MKKRAIEIMKKYYDGNEKQINHTIKVLDFAEKIYNGESLKDQFVYNTTILSAIFHDIGIPEAYRKYGSAIPKYQEMEGPSVARKLMEEINIRPDIIERVCYIVGHHHTLSSVDSTDFQILWEADYLVNVQEGSIILDKTQHESEIAKNFKTQTGKQIIEKVFNEM